MQHVDVAVRISLDIEPSFGLFKAKIETFVDIKNQEYGFVFQVQALKKLCIQL